MALDLTRLIDDFEGYFLGLYQPDKLPAPRPQAAVQAATGPASRGPFLAFECLGTPITPDMFTPSSGEPNPGLVVEQFSLLANVLPRVEDGSIAGPGLPRVDRLYGTILDQAQAVAAEDMEAFGATKRQGATMFADTLPGMTPGTVAYRPTVPTPANWPLPSGAASWPSYSFEQFETAATRPRPATWTWYVAPPDLADKLHSVEAVRTSVPPRQIAPPRAPTTFHPLLGAATAARTEEATATAGPATEPLTRPAPAAMPRVSLRSDVMMLRIAELSRRSTPRAVTAKRLKLSFDYCLVTASRPWLSAELLAARNWYLPRTKAGELASGTGTGDGAFEVMPVAALAVRNLAIKADFSSDEAAVLDKLDRFGPFSLVGRTIAAGGDALECKGMQIIGWVVEPMPCLPPNSDPALDDWNAPKPVIL